MAVGTDALRCYQGEDVNWEWTFTDSNVTTIVGWTIQLVIKATADDGPALVGPISCTVTSASSPMTFAANFNVALDHGTFLVSVRRVDSGFSWQLVDSQLIVTGSASIN